MRDDSETLPREPGTEDEAREIIDQIRFDHGIFDTNDEIELDKVSTRLQKRLRESAKRTRKSLAAITKVVSSQLYSSKFRFMYELIQNADDSSYSKSIKDYRMPFIKFKIRPGEIVIDSNEDGFTVADVYAICSTAQSSKLGNQNQTGEKGLGFKSVFAIANRVQIHSGLWSFEFRYPKWDDGIGMITPHWKNIKEPLENDIGTRITLTLARKDSEFQLELVKAFEDISDTVLLFLRQLEKLEISFGDEKRETESHIFTRRDDWNDSEKATSAKLKGRKNDFLYKIWSESVPISSDSEPDEIDESSEKLTMVELAFPVDASTSSPYVTDRGQHVFAFLPMKRMAQLPFIIQADFDTAASREAVTDESWNRQLREAVAQSFADAMAYFCSEEPSLRFSWTKYVPGKQLDEFWRPLHQMVQINLAEKSLLVSQAGGRLRPISELRFVPSDFEHEEIPLFESKLYLSKKYNTEAVDTLKRIGLPILSKREMLKSVKDDLKMDRDTSLIKSKDLHDSWHTTLIEFLHSSICRDKRLESELSQLKILPLSSEEGVVWVAPATITSGNMVYFSKVDEDDAAPVIKHELGLRVLHETVSKIPERCNFYRYWGIGHAETSTAIEAAFNRNRKRRSKTVDDYVQQFAILFWHSADLQLNNLYAADEDRKVRSTANLYLRSDTPYSVSTLVGGKIDTSSCGFINSSYLNCSVRKHVRDDGKTWVKWLEDVAEIRQYPHLVDADTGRLSSIFQEIIRKRPSKVIGTLWKHWDSYKRQIITSSEVLEALKTALVQCKTGELSELSRTILPTAATLAASRDFGVEQTLRFLNTNDDAGPADDQDWFFLERFGVCCQPSLNFHLNALETLTQTSHPGNQIATHATAIYNGVGSISKLDDCEMLKEFFTNHSAIYASQNWFNMNDCVWDGPEFPIGKTVLAKEYEGNSTATYLFASLLGIRNAAYNDIFVEIKRLSGQSNLDSRTHEPIDSSKMSSIYSKLEEMVNWIENGSEIQMAFEESPLIFDGRSWVKLSSCIWSSAVTLKGKVILNGLYPKLRNFFVRRLGVRAINIAMLLEELIKILNGGEANPGEVKDLLRHISSMLANEEPTENVDDLIRKLRQLKFLPLSSENSDNGIFASPKDAFLIADDRRLYEIFHGRVKMLDFPPNELSLMQPLFASFRLENRYISRCVQAETTVGDSNVDYILTEDMRRRSYAISCCALSHKSIDVEVYKEQKHQQLVTCEIVVSDDIRTVFRVTQDKNTISIESNANAVKISDQNGTLKIFVPLDITQRQRCYRAQLPAELMRYLDISAQRAEKQLYRILNDPLSEVNDVLSEEGIPEDCELERVEWQNDDELDLPNEDREAISLRSNFASGSQGRADVAITSVHYSIDTFSGNRSNHVANSLLPDGYRKVLDNVVRQGRARGSEELDITSRREVSNSFESPVSRGDLGILSHQPVSQESFQRIGAAGELFVFERLRASGLINFSESNWQSSIRHLVRALPDYESIERYPSLETVDIMYEDRCGSMQTLLRDSSVNEFSQWPLSADRPIQYYIEVKTTINDFDEPFFVSQNQYKLLSENALVEDHQPQVVYVLARVYDLLSPNIGLKIYVDPKNLEGNTLRFDWGHCAVTAQE